MQLKPQALRLAWELVRERELGPEPHPKVMVAQQLVTPGVQRIQELALSLVLEPAVERELAPQQETEQELEQL